VPGGVWWTLLGQVEDCRWIVGVTLDHHRGGASALSPRPPRRRPHLRRPRGDLSLRSQGRPGRARRGLAAKVDQAPERRDNRAPRRRSLLVGSVAGGQAGLEQLEVGEVTRQRRSSRRVCHGSRCRPSAASRPGRVSLRSIWSRCGRARPPVVARTDAVTGRGWRSRARRRSATIAIARPATTPASAHDRRRHAEREEEPQLAERRPAGAAARVLMWRSGRDRVDSGSATTREATERGYVGTLRSGGGVGDFVRRPSVRVDDPNCRVAA
jgi:hypothetical protein